MAGRASRRPNPPVKQRSGAGGHGAAAELQPIGRLLSRHLQPGRRDQPQAEGRGSGV